jgi:hypothetical protein
MILLISTIMETIFATEVERDNDTINGRPG